MLEFMDSMESEFGIPPQKIVEAMANLPKDQQLQSPEETAAQVIDALELPPEAAERAYSLYAGMLNQLAQPPQPLPEAKPELLVAVPSSQMQQNALAAKERKAMLSDSLDRMNDKFFMQDRANMAMNRMTGPDSMNTKMEASQLVDKLSFDKAQGYPMLQPDQKQIANPKEGLNLQDPNLGQAQPQGSEDDAMKTLMAKLSAVGASAAALGKAAAKADGQGPNAEAPSAAGAGAPGGLGLASLTGSAAAAISSARGDSSSFGSDADDGENQGESSRTDGLEGLGRGQDGLKIGDKLGFQEALQASSIGTAKGTDTEAMKANIDKLMSQAQIIAQKGGGEAKIRMTPEGLGQVELKVIVKDGKVNVELATETKEAKKMIESALSDLKLGLAGHKLSLESVKVDTSMQSSADQLNQQQKNPDARPDQGRDQARQFFQQFRDDNLSRREPFFEMPGSRAYRTPSRAADPIGPAGEAKVQRKVEGRGERMNLVA
ncbi:MAG: flagellar hook-length control protein FliK [Bdellovibrionaceae bacterium]|nr:flagellar hook-length control protein FliK [Pseudobdellovibrionaceae bacterium]